jgi:hypothetical protein
LINRQDKSFFSLQIAVRTTSVLENKRVSGDRTYILILEGI